MPTKYAASNRFMVIRSLAWFGDAENEPDPIDLCGATWEDVKTAITGALSRLC